MQPVSDLRKFNLALEKSGEDYYQEGKQLDENQEFEKATAIYKKAVELGHVPAAMLLAEFYLCDEINLNETIKYAEKGLETTGGKAEYFIGRAYFKMGNDHLKEAQDFFEKSFNQSYQKSEYFLALIYLESPMRYEDGFSILLKLATEENHLTAQSEIAKIYQKKGSQEDLIQARKWFEKACENPKCPPSNKYYLAKMYLKGEGGEQRTDQGLELLKNNNDGDSYALLSFAYLKGVYGIEENRKIFCDYLGKAYNLGNQWAIQTYAHFCEKGLEGVIDKNLAKALEIYKWQAALGKQWAKEGLEKINSQSED